MPLFSCLDHFLDVRAEILQIFRVKFWKIVDFKNCFRDLLTFSSVSGGSVVLAGAAGMQAQWADREENACA